MIDVIIVLIAVTGIATCMAVWELWDNISAMRSCKALVDAYTSPSDSKYDRDELSRNKDSVRRSALMVLATFVWPVSLVYLLVYFIIDLIKGVREAWK